MDAEVVRKLELFAATMDEIDVAFMLKTTPARIQIETILKMRYGTITGKVVERLSFGDILQRHKDDAEWLVLIARRHWDPQDLQPIKEAFLKLGFSELVWRMIRFTPQEQVRPYLDVVKKYDNVPFAFLEKLRVEAGLPAGQMADYIESHVPLAQLAMLQS